MVIATRPAVLMDADEFGRIQVAAWRSAYAGVMDKDFLDKMNPDRWAAQWRVVLGVDSEAPDGAWAHLVAELDGAVVAWCVVGPARDTLGDRAEWATEVARFAPFPEAQLWAINAHPDAYGTGAAKALHDEAITIMRARASSAYLWVARDNPRARRFYEREGWEPDPLEQTDRIGGADVVEVRYVREFARHT